MLPIFFWICEAGTGLVPMHMLAMTYDHDCTGGCPAGPSEQSAPQGSFATSRDGDSVTFTWSKPEVAADAPKVIGYYMAAMEQPAASIQRVTFAKASCCSTFDCAPYVSSTCLKVNEVVRCMLSSPAFVHFAQSF